MWLFVSSLSPHNLHLLFCCVLSILALIWLVHMALFCVVIRRNSFSLLRFHFLSHIHVLFVSDSALKSLKTFMQLFFFLFLFSGYFRSVGRRVVSIVYSGCNQSYSALYYYYYYLLIIVFHWSFTGSKSPQVSRILHSILAVFDSAVVWTVCGFYDNNMILFKLIRFVCSLIKFKQHF